jgi:tetratricopeptide (TPR) repeat protein
MDGGNFTNPEKAIEYLDEAIRLRPDIAESYYNMGVAYIKLGQYQRALEDFNEVIGLRPEFASAYYNRGFAYTALGQYQQGIEDYNEAIRLRPDNANAYNNRGFSYLLLHDNKEMGCRDAQKACALGNCTLIGIAQRMGYCR